MNPGAFYRHTQDVSCTLVTGLEPASLPLNEAPVDSGF